MKYEVEPCGDQWSLKKNGVICGLFNSEQTANDNIEVQENLEKLKKDFTENSGK